MGRQGSCMQGNTSELVEPQSAGAPSALVLQGFMLYVSAFECIYPSCAGT